MPSLTTARRSDGRYTRSAEQAERDAQAARYVALGWTYARIGEHFGVTKQAAFYMVHRALNEAGKETREEALSVELAKLDAYEQAALEVLARKHVTVSNGRLITIDGEPLLDDGPVLQALDRLMKIADRRARLLGLDAPSRVEVTDSLDADIERLVAELAGRAEAEATEPAAS